MQLPSKSFRYPNVRGLTDIMDYYIPKAQWYINRGRLLPWKDGDWATHNPTMHITKTIGNRYCLGAPMESVFEAVRLKIDLELMTLDEIIRDPGVIVRREISYVPEVLDMIFSYSCLIQDYERIGIGAEKANALLLAAGETIKFPEYVELCREIALLHRINVNLMKRVENAARSQELSPDNERVINIAKKGEAIFNESIRRDYLRPQLRRYNSNPGEELNPSELFNVNGLVMAAFAVHYGLKLDFKDPAIPIWDFPVGKAFPDRIVQ